MTTAEVTPTSIALAIIGGQKEILADVLEKIPTEKASVQDVFPGESSMAADLMRALKGADTDRVDAKVADIITDALAGVTLIADGAAYTAPWLHHVAHFLKVHKTGRIPLFGKLSTFKTLRKRKATYRRRHRLA